MIWCVEDDGSIRDIVIYTLKTAGFEARGFEDGLACWDALGGDRPELILLDVMLPGMDGVELLRQIKSTPGLEDIPVIMATAKGAEYDKILSLDLGADDYLVKPFGMLEMVSRVKAVLRRCQPKKTERLYRAGDLTVNLDERTVSVKGERVALTYKEFELLRTFLSRPGVVFSRDQLFCDVWGQDFIGESRTVDMHIRTLRQKLGDWGAMIETVRSVGYKWEAGGDK